MSAVDAPSAVDAVSDSSEDLFLLQPVIASTAASNTAAHVTLLLIALPISVPVPAASGIPPECTLFQGKMTYELLCSFAASAILQTSEIRAPLRFALLSDVWRVPSPNRLSGKPLRARSYGLARCRFGTLDPYVILYFCPLPRSSKAAAGCRGAPGRFRSAKRAWVLPAVTQKAHSKTGTAPRDIRPAARCRPFAILPEIHSPIHCRGEGSAGAIPSACPSPPAKPIPAAPAARAHTCQELPS